LGHAALAPVERAIRLTQKKNLIGSKLAATAPGGQGCARRGLGAWPPPLAHWSSQAAHRGGPHRQRLPPSR